MEAISRRIDKLGRIVLPVDFRKSLGMPTQSEVIITVIDSAILIRKNRNICRLCLSKTDSLNGSLCICSDCITRIKEL